MNITDRIINRSVGLFKDEKEKQKEVDNFIQLLLLALIGLLNAGISRKVFREAKEILDKNFQTFADDFEEYLNEVGNGEKKFLSKLLTVPNEKDYTINSLLVSGIPIREWLKRQKEDIRQRYVDQVRIGMSRGDDFQKLRARIIGGVEELPDNTIKKVRGIDIVVKKNSDFIVRNSILAVVADSRREFYSENSDLIECIRQESVLDNRTTPTCVEYDGATWDLDFNPTQGNLLPYDGGVPRHWNCRSVEIPCLK